jgi:UDP-glucose 4-epimerase
LPGWPDTDAPIARPDLAQPEPPERFLQTYGSRSLSDILGIALTMRPFENRPFVAPRATRAFAQRGINTLGQVLRMTPYQLLRVQGVGTGSIWAILTSMNRMIPFPTAQSEFTAEPAQIGTDFPTEGTSFAIPTPSGFIGERVLVTGGLGFVGSNLVHALSAAGANVVVLDDGFTGTKQNIADCSNVEVVGGSVTDPDVMRWVMQRIDTAFHLACRNIVVSTKDPYADAQVNAMGTANVLLAARDCGVRRVVFTSSASIYGNARRLPAFEEDPADLLSPYAASKYAAEAFCSAYYESLGVPVTVLRLSNVYGPYQRPDNPYCGVVSKFMDAAIQSEPLVIFGDGEQTRDFTFVGDAVEAILQAALSPKAEGRLYNVATGNEVSVNHLAEMVMKTSGQVCRIEKEAKRDIDSVRRRALSADRIRRELRWSARTSLSDGLQKTFEWLRGLQP